MSVWTRHTLHFDPQDEVHVDAAVDMAGRLSIDYIPAMRPKIQLHFVNDADETIFKLAHQSMIPLGNNMAKLPSVVTLAAIADTLDALSPGTGVGLCLEADLWCRDGAAEQAFNSALATLAGRFLGPPPTI